MIRLAREADLPQILAIYGPYVLTTATSFEYTVPSLDEFTQRFRTVTAQFPWLVWEEEGTVLGYAYASAPFSRAAYQWCAASSVYLAPQAQGKGIGRKLYAALEELLSLQGYRKTYAIITSANEASRRFHEAAGFRFVAALPECGVKFGKLYGIIWMEKSLNSGEIPQNPPYPIWKVVKADRIFL